MSNDKVKKLLIIEPKLIHWTTVEPLIVCFLKKGWKVDVIIPGPFLSIFSHYSKMHNIGDRIKSLTFHDYNNINPFSLLFRSKPDVSIVADRFFWEKPISKPLFKQILSNIRLTFRSIIKLLLIRYYLHKSFFVITTHFVDLVKLPDKCFTKSKITNYFLKCVWEKSRKYNNAINVYSSLVKANIVNPNNKSVFVAPNAIYRYAEKERIPTRNENLLIIIPGRIDTRRRYYEWIDKLNPNLKDKLDLKFIGKAQTDDDLEFVKKLEKNGFEQIVKMTNQFIDFDEFDSYLENADLFFVPFVELEDEKRKIDRNLGAFFDSVRYGKPLIIPDSVPVAAELADNILTYNDDDHLVAMIEKIISDLKYFDSISSKAIDNSMNWATNNITYPNDLIEQLN